MTYLIFGAIVAIATLYILVYAWPVLLAGLVILVGWAAYVDLYTDGGASLDVAYYCEVLGTDQTTAEWKDVYDYTLFDDRHIDEASSSYYQEFRSMSCDTATAKAEPGEYGVVDEKVDEIGYARRYFYFRNGNVQRLYRDKDQFLWQRALFLRVEEDCNLNRETSACIEVPDNCSWSDVKSSYGDECLYDSGKGNYTRVLSKNIIKNYTW